MGTIRCVVWKSGIHYQCVKCRTVTTCEFFEYSFSCRKKSVVPFYWCAMPAHLNSMNMNESEKSNGELMRMWPDKRAWKMSGHFRFSVGKFKNIQRLSLQRYQAQLLLIVTARKNAIFWLSMCFFLQTDFSFFHKNDCGGFSIDYFNVTHSLAHNTQIFFKNYYFRAILHKYIFKSLLLYLKRYTHSHHSFAFAFTGYSCVQYAHIIQQSTECIYLHPTILSVVVLFVVYPI